MFGCKFHLCYLILHDASVLRSNSILRALVPTDLRADFVIGRVWGRYRLASEGSAEETFQQDNVGGPVAAADSELLAVPRQSSRYFARSVAAWSGRGLLD